MAYRFAQERQDYRDFAAGSVFYGLPGHPAFPIRLTSEIFQRCMDLRARDGQSSPCHVYDPCCGAGYSLATLVFLHWNDVQAVSGSDPDRSALEVAARNLNLLTLEGLNQRIAQIEGLIQQFDKPSHREALQSAQLLRATLAQSLLRHAVEARTFSANAITDDLAMHFSTPVDLVIADIPYGNRSSWIGLSPDSPHEPPWYMLQSLLKILSGHSIVAIASSKQQKIAHDRYRRVEHFQIGKRRVVILRPLGLSGS